MVALICNEDLSNIDRIHNSSDKKLLLDTNIFAIMHARFTRNAGLVASGVARNMRKVGNYIKESVDDILYPYRRRPK